MMTQTVPTSVPSPTPAAVPTVQPQRLALGLVLRPIRIPIQTPRGILVVTYHNNSRNCRLRHSLVHQGSLSGRRNAVQQS